VSARSSNRSAGAVGSHRGAASRLDGRTVVEDRRAGVMGDPSSGIAEQGEVNEGDSQADRAAEFFSVPQRGLRV
jgi:hypothetical protein